MRAKVLAVLRSPRRGRGFFYSVAIDAIWPLFRLLTTVRWRGLRHVGPGGVLVASNHVSLLDPVPVTALCLAAGRIPRYLAMAELWRIPLVRNVVSGGGHIPVDRGSMRAVRSLRAAVTAVRAGECVVVFPEGGIGTRSDHWPDAARVKNGIARIALESKAPVVPVATWGTHELLPPGARFPRVWPRRTVRVSAGPPVDLADLYAAPRTRTTLDEATKRIMAAITEQLAAARGA